MAIAVYTQKKRSLEEPFGIQNDDVTVGEPFRIKKVPRGTPLEKYTFVKVQTGTYFVRREVQI